jgi:DNA-binding response OmpR family regulator
MATILYIDHEPRILALYATLMEAKGYKVLTAPDGATGIALTRNHAVDAVVSGFNMPGMDGYQVAKTLKKEQPMLPVVIWSGCPEKIPESVKSFGDAWLNKGDGPETLLSTIEIILKNSANPKTARSEAVHTEN